MFTVDTYVDMLYAPFKGTTRPVETFLLLDTYKHSRQLVRTGYINGRTHFYQLNTLPADDDHKDRLFLHLIGTWTLPQDVRVGNHDGDLVLMNMTKSTLLENE